MVLENTIFTSIVRNGIEIFSLLISFLLFDKPRYSIKKTVVCYSLFLLIGAMASTVWLFYDIDSFGKYCTVTLMIVCLVFLVFMSEDSFPQVLFNLSMQTFILLLQVILSVIITIKFFNGNTWVDIALRLVYLAGLIVFYVKFGRKFYRNIADNLRSKWWSIAIASLAGNGLVLFYGTRPIQITIRSLDEQLIFMAIWGLLFATHIVMLRTLSVMQNQLMVQKQIEIYSMSGLFFQKQLDMLEETAENACRMRHDLRHHNMVIAEYARKNQNDELLKYLDEYDKKLLESAYMRVCENIVIDNIISAYMAKAERRGIEMKAEVLVGKDTGIKDTDMVAILANLLENAVYGCESSCAESMKINVFITLKERKLVIEITNTCKKELYLVDGLPQTADREGIGLTSVLYSVKQYGGEITFNAEKGICVCRVLLKCR